MAFLLNIPYFGQVGAGADEHFNDCGATCVFMVLKHLGITPKTIDEIFNKIQKNTDKYLTVGDLLSLLTQYGVNADWNAGYENKDLWETLSKGIAPIALIRYGALSSIRPNKFTGSHYVVVVGMDLDSIYIHDPLNVPTSGKNIAVPLPVWESCWSTVGDNNPQRSLIIPAKVQGISTNSNIIRYVTPKDANGCNVRSIAGDTSIKTKLYAIPYGERIPIFVERDGWGKIHFNEEQWICLAYTKEA